MLGILKPRIYEFYELTNLRFDKPRIDEFYELTNLRVDD